MGSVWCRSVSCCSSWLIMSGTSNGCLRYGRVAFHKTKAPKLFKDSLNSKWFFFSFSFLFCFFFLNYYFFSQSWVKVIPGWKFGALHVWFRQTDLCQQKKRKKVFLWQLPCFLLAIHWILSVHSFVSHMLLVCSVSVALHVTQCPVSLPVPPEALISCWKLAELDKGHG